MMEWMINTQLGRRNLPPAQRISVVDKFKKKIQEQAENKKDESNQSFYGNRYTGKLESTPIGVQSKSRSNTWTDSQTAKKAGVGTGTIARYNRVMNSDDEELKEKVAVEYVKLCGYKNGEIGRNHIQDSHNGKAEKLTLEEIAKQLGTSKTNLTRALTIERNLTEPMKKLLDDGVISKTDQQRKWENVLRNWKGYMGLKEGTINIACRILRYPLNPT